MSSDAIFNTSAILTPFIEMILYGLGMNGWLTLGLTPFIFFALAIAFTAMFE